MKILSVDIGTNLGYCFGDTSSPSLIEAGTWKLAGAKEITSWGKTRLTRRCDPRIARFAEYLRKFPLAEMIVFEDVQFSSTVLACQLWASLRAVLWIDYPPGTKFECVPVATLKKFATGSGAADKQKMRQCLESAISVPEAWDDNAVDAVWIWLWAKQQFSRLTPRAT